MGTSTFHAHGHEAMPPDVERPPRRAFPGGWDVRAWVAWLRAWWADASEGGPLYERRPDREPPYFARDAA
jgi:hypothetical protein